MKKLRKFLCLLLVLTMLLPMATSALAADTAEEDLPEEAAIEATTAEEPAEESEVETPAEEPAKEPAAEVPAEEPAAEVPAEEPVAEVPAEEPAAEVPAEEPEAEVPVEEPVAEIPVEEPVTETVPAEPEAEVPVAMPAQSFDGDVDKTKVHVEAPENALPEGTQMEVEAVELDAVQALIDADADINGTALVAVDITFKFNGETIQPAKEVLVSITSPEAVEAVEPFIVHIADDKALDKVDVEDDTTLMKNASSRAVSRTLTFGAESFSVYVVVGGEDPVPRYTYNFVDGEGNPYPFLNTAGQTVTSQIIKDGESLMEIPAPGLLNNQSFVMWVYDGGDLDGQEVKFGEAITVTEDKEFTVKAYYGSVIYVTFWQYAAGKVVLERKQIAKNADGKYICDMSSVTVPAPSTTLKFMGWSLDQGTETSETEGDVIGSRELLPNSNYEFTEDTDVYPVYYHGVWIIFVSAETGLGASYVPSYFLSADSANASAAEPSAPTMTGYTFDNWYTEAEPVADYAKAEDNTHGEKFNFSTSFADLENYVNDRGEVVLYGHWKPGNTTYIVVYWKQQIGNDKNAADSAKTYDYAGQTDPITAATGSAPTPTSAQRTADTGFEYKRYRLTDSEGNEITGIAADQSSILNVYFDRKLIYFRFRTNTNTTYNGNWTSSSYATTYTGLYGQTWAQAGYTTDWPAPAGTNRWGFFNNSNGTTGMSYLGQFIPPDTVRDPNKVDVRFYYNGTSSYTVNLYVQNTNGTWPTSTSISGRTSGTFNLTDKLEGFVVSAYRVGNNGNWTNVTYTTNSDGTHSYRPSSVSNIGNGPLNLRYARLSYEIKYLNPLNEEPVLDPETLLYGASLSTVKPAASTEIELGVPGYEWDGKWYKDKACTVEFDFDSETMPLDGTKVYAGKRALYYYIKIDPNGGQLQTNQATWRWVTYGDDTTYTYDNIERNYIEYKGTGTAYYYYYDEFDESRRDDIWNYEYMASNPRTALYTTGDIPAGGGAAWLGTDQFSYEKDAYALIGWYDVTDGGMVPFKTGTAITKDTVIQAQWRRTGEYGVVYSVEAVDNNGNALNDDGGNRVMGANSPVDSAKYADQSDSAIMDKMGVIPAGYEFIGWFYDGAVYQPGDVFQIHARLSDDNKLIYIYPVLEPVETLPVEVINITFDPNGGVFTSAADTEISAIIASVKAEDDGTYNPVKVDNADGTKTINKLKINEGFALLSAESVQNGIEVDGTMVPGRGYRLKEWNTQPDGSGTSFEIGKVTDIGVDDDSTDPLNKVPNKLYAIWEPLFYVCHSSDGSFDTISLESKSIPDRWAMTKGFDPDGTANKTQYTDYYYGGFAVYADGKTAADGLTFEAGDVKSGSIADSYWTRAKAAKSADLWNTADVGAVYYLKEVPTDYLAKPVAVTIKGNYGKGDITSIHFLSVTDTNIYRAGGIKLQGTDTKGSFAKNFTLTQNNGSTTTITAQSQFSLPGYLTVVNGGVEAGSFTACQAYWTTYDYVNVYGIEQNIKDITIE